MGNSNYNPVPWSTAQLDCCFIYTSKPSGSMFGGCDTTNDGVSSYNANMRLISLSRYLESPDKWDPDNTLVLVWVHERANICAVPVSALEGAWHMFGGNFVYTSDSRFPSRQPIKIHDRVEGKTTIRLVQEAIEGREPFVAIEGYKSRNHFDRDGYLKSVAKAGGFEIGTPFEAQIIEEVSVNDWVVIARKELSYD